MKMAEQLPTRGALDPERVTRQAQPQSLGRAAGPISGTTIWGAFCAFVLLGGPLGAQAAPIAPAVPQLTPVLAPLGAVSTRAARALSSRELPLMPPVPLPGAASRLVALSRPLRAYGTSRMAAAPHHTLSKQVRTVRMARVGTPQSALQNAAQNVAPGVSKNRFVHFVSVDTPVAPATPTASVVDSTPATMAPSLAAPTLASPTLPVSSDIAGLPAANALPPSLPPQVKGSMNKVISVSSLHLPPATQPLPGWMRGAEVAIDRPYVTSNAKSLPRLAASGTLHQPAHPVTSSDRLPNQIEVAVGTFVVLLTNTDLQTVAIAEPNTADVSVVNARAVLVNGKAPGTTSLVIVDHKKIRQYQVRVTPPPGTQPSDVQAAIGMPTVSVRQLRGALVLDGEVSTDEDSKRAAEIAGIYSDKVINQLVVRPVMAGAVENAAQIQQAINIPGVSVRMIGDTAMLEGMVDSVAQSQRAERIAAVMNPKVLNLLELPRLTLDQIRQSLGIAAEATTPQPQPDPNAPTVTPPMISGGSVTPPGTPTGGIVGQFGNSTGLAVRQIGDQLILEGQLSTQEDIDRTLTLASRSGLTLINHLTLAPPPGAEQQLLNTVASAIGIPGIRVRGSSKRLVLTGTVSDTNTAMAAEQIARGYSDQVDDLLQTSNPLLVDVDVRIVEITRGKINALGVGFPGLQDPAVGPGGGLPLGTIGAGEGAVNTVRATLTPDIRALLQDNSTHLLSNPHTTVLSGRLASFQVGGQVPIPSVSTVGSNGQTTGLEYKDFGVLVNITPTASVDGAVTMRIATEVSQPDFSIGVTPPGGGSIVPGFSRRSAVTEVTVQPNGTIALAGLIQNNVLKSKIGIPVLSRIPILGALFSSKRFERNETELAIFVTPHVLANPLAPGATAPASVVSATAPSAPGGIGLTGTFPATGFGGSTNTGGGQ